MCWMNNSRTEKLSRELRQCASAKQARLEGKKSEKVTKIIQTHNWPTHTEWHKLNGTARARAKIWLSLLRLQCDCITNRVLYFISFFSTVLLLITCSIYRLIQFVYAHMRPFVWTTYVVHYSYECVLAHAAPLTQTEICLYHFFHSLSIACNFALFVSNFFPLHVLWTMWLRTIRLPAHTSTRQRSNDFH